MDITKLSITELKALAYDQLAELERVQANINALNTQISNLSNQKAEPKQEEEDGKEK